MSGEERRAWLAEHWVGWLRPVSIMALMGVLAAVYFLRWVPESPFARLLAVLFALAAAVAPAAQGARLATKPWGRWATMAIGLVVAVSIVWPVWRMTAPGDPIAEKALAKGETLDIPAAPSGALTVLVEDPDLLVGGLDQKIDYRLEISDGAQRQATLSGELSRVHRAGRGRRGAPTASETVHATELHTLDWSRGAALHMSVVARGGTALVVRIFDSAVPWVLLFALLGAALVAGVVVDALALPPLERTFVPHATAIGLVFLVMTRDALEPVAPVKPLFGSLLISAVAGVVAGILLSWAGRRVLAPKAARSGGRRPAGARRG